MHIAKEIIEGRKKIAVVGLGYVGLPIAVAFAKRQVKVIGFDISPKKIEKLSSGIDETGECTPADLIETKNNLSFSNDPACLKDAAFIIVAVPTPITKNKVPDLTPLESASQLVGKNLGDKPIIVYESTVYPGVTEEVCIPEIEKASGKSWEAGDFYVGYSPERINPGDKEHRLESIVKIVSGQNDQVLDQVAQVYEIVIDAGVHRAESIKVAEAAKVIENTQRDLNIALMNELAIIFQRIGISTEEVLRAAGTKWNFLKFHPGLVGGHCIGVDPYYLTNKAEQLGYHPQVVLAGRRINDSMGAFVAEQTIKQLIKASKVVVGANILVMGLTFKENVPDFRNSRVVDIINELKTYGVNVLACDPYIKEVGLPKEFDVEIVDFKSCKDLDGIVIATPHQEIIKTPLNELKQHCRVNDGKPILIDVRWSFKEKDAQASGFHYWRF